MLVNSQLVCLPPVGILGVWKCSQHGLSCLINYLRKNSAERISIHFESCGKTLIYCSSKPRNMLPPFATRLALRPTTLVVFLAVRQFARKCCPYNQVTKTLIIFCTAKPRRSRKFARTIRTHAPYAQARAHAYLHFLCTTIGLRVFLAPSRKVGCKKSSASGPSSFSNCTSTGSSNNSLKLSVKSELSIPVVPLLSRLDCRPGV